MALQHTSNISFFNRKYEEIHAPSEWEKVYLGIEGYDEVWDQYTLYINDILFPLSLKVINGSKKIISDTIRLGTGHYKIKIVFKSIIQFFSFYVRSSKITEDAYEKMLDELAFQLPADISVSLSELGAFSAAKNLRKDQVTMAQELLRLKKTIKGNDKKTGLIKLIEMIAKKPHHVLKTNSLVVRRENARRVNSVNLISSVFKSGNLDAKGLPIKVTDSRNEHTFNIYENQLLKVFVQQIQTRIRKLLKIFVTINNKILIEETLYLQRIVQITIKKTKFLNDVELPSHFTLKPTMVLLNIPSYRTLLEEYINFQKVISSNINDPGLDSPLENTPALYQKWGTLKVISKLLMLAVDKGYIVKSQSLIGKSTGDKIVRILPDGKPALVLQHPEKETIIKLIPERPYIKKGNPFKSISFTQKPDISIEVSKCGILNKIYIFDPKYKLDSEENGSGEEVSGGKPKKVDIDKMHSYRDAIRDIVGNRIVSYAAILYPGKTYKYDTGLGAIQTLPTENNEFDKNIESIILDILDN